MTIRFVLWVIAVVATIGVSQLQERLFSPYLVLFICLLAPVSLLYDVFFKKLRLRVKARDEMVQRGQAASWQLQLVNDDRNRTHFLDYTQKSSDHGNPDKKMIHMPPQTNETIDIQVDTRHCGIQQPPGFSLGYLSLFGLFRLPLKQTANQSLSPVYVLPAVHGSLSQPSPFGDLIKLGQLQSSGREANHDEIDHMREMMAGDSMRLIHWKLSARLQEWMVRQYAKAQEKSVHVLVELPELLNNDEAGLSYRDELLERVAAEIRGFLYHDFQVTLVTHEPDVLVQTVRGLDRFDSLRRQLAVVAPKKHVPLVVQLAGDIGERSSLVFYIATSTIDQDSARELSELQRTSGGVLLEILSDGLSQQQKELVKELQYDGLEVVVRPRNGENDD